MHKGAHKISTTEIIAKKKEKEVEILREKGTVKTRKGVEKLSKKDVFPARRKE